MLKHMIIKSYRSNKNVNFYHLIQCIFNEIQEIIYGYAMDMPRFRQLASSLPRVLRYLSAIPSSILNSSGLYDQQ